jgi:hypothetical protein
MAEEIKKPKIQKTEEDIWDELRRLMRSVPFLSKILEKFNILSILLGVISFFILGLLLSLIGLFFGIIAKREKQKWAIWGIVLNSVSLGGLIIFWTTKDILVGNYQVLTKTIVEVASFAFLMVVLRFFEKKEKK